MHTLHPNPLHIHTHTHTSAEELKATAIEAAPEKSGRLKC